MRTKLLFLFAMYSLTVFSQTNLVTNGGFEDWTNTTTLSNWTIENDVSQNTMDRTEGSSSASLKIGNTNLSPKVLTLVPLEKGITYTVNYMYKYVDSNFKGTHSICIKLVKTGSATTTTKCSIPNDNRWNTSTTTFTPDQTGDYDLSVSTSNFFDNESFEILIDKVQIFDPSNLSVTDIITKENFKIYPTITDNIVYFKQIESDANYKIIVFDSNGKKQNVKIKSNSIDVSLLKSGLYFVHYSTNTKNITQKIIKK